MKRMACVLLATALLVPRLAIGAQDKDEAIESKVVQETTKVFRINHVDVRELYGIMDAFPAKIRFSDGIGVLAASGSKETLAAISEALRELDVPGAPAQSVQSRAARNVNLTFHILRAARQHTGTPAVSRSPMRSLPSSLEKVAEQLTANLGFEQLTLLSTAVIRARDGRSGKTSGLLSGIAEQPVVYAFEFSRADVLSSVGGSLVRLDNLVLVVRVPYGSNSVGDAMIRTDIDVGVGQMAVVGTSGLDAAGNQMIVVVTPSLVD